MSLIPGWVKLLVLAGVVLGLVAACQWRDDGLRAEGAAAERALWLERDRREAENHAQERQRRLERQEDAHRESQKRLAAAEAGRVRADAAAGQLRDQLAAFVAGAARDCAAEPGGAPAGDPIGVLADLLGRADDRAGRLAAFADQAHAAGLACEREYDANRPVKP